MASRRNRIGAAIETALNAATAGAFTKPDGFVAHRDQHRVQQKDNHPGGVIYYVGNISVNDRGGDLVENTDEFVVLIRALGNQSEAPDDSIDPSFLWVTRAIMNDILLGGEATLTKMGLLDPLQSDEDDRIYVSLVQRVEVTYETNRSDPEANS